MNPIASFPKLIKEEEESKELYAFAFCYCLDDSRKVLNAYLRLRLIYAKPKKYDAEAPHSDKMGAIVYTNPIGEINRRLSSMDNFEWLIDRVKILQIDEDTDKWADIHSMKFPLSPSLSTMHGQINEKIYEGNIISRKRLNDIYEKEILKNKKSGIMKLFRIIERFPN